jgi:hypothetical protein
VYRVNGRVEGIGIRLHEMCLKLEEESRVGVRWQHPALVLFLFLGVMRDVRVPDDILYKQKLCHRAEGNRSRSKLNSNEYTAR